MLLGYNLQVGSRCIKGGSRRFSYGGTQSKGRMSDTDG